MLLLVVNSPLPQVHQSGLGWAPVYPLDNLGVISIGFLLQHPDEAIIWRGPKKNGMIKQFLKALLFLLSIRLSPYRMSAGVMSWIT